LAARLIKNAWTVRSDSSHEFYSISEPVPCKNSIHLSWHPERADPACATVFLKANQNAPLEEYRELLLNVDREKFKSGSIKMKSQIF
jgi:hypothetical protein